MIPNTYEELRAAFIKLKQEFEDHQHTGLDSRPVENTLASQGTITAINNATVDGVYGAQEAGVIQNNRTRIEEIETALTAVGILE